MNAWRTALEQVFDLQQNPNAFESMRQQRLPEGMASLIRLASDSGGLLQDVAQTLDIDAELLQSQVSNYLLVVCLYSESNPVRLLCLNDTSNFALAKEHHRLLLKWLHPDKNTQNIACAERVNQAWTWFKNLDHTAGRALLSNTEIKHAHMQSPSPSPKSRFPLFLAAAVASGAVLLVISFWQDEQVYIYGANNSAQSNNELDATNAQQDLDQSLLNRLKTPVNTVNSALPVKSLPPVHKPLIKKQFVNKPVAIQEVVAENISIAEQNKQVPTISQQPTAIVIQEAPAKVQTEHTEIVRSQVLTAKTAVTEPSMPSNTVISIDHGKQLLDDFARTYQAGNLQQFMLLFSAKARNDHGGRSALEQDYRYLFAQSSRREIQFSNLQWHDKERFSLSAHYNTKVKWPNKIWHNRNSGSIKFYFIQENGKVRIQQILLGE